MLQEFLNKHKIGTVITMDLKDSSYIMMNASPNKVFKLKVGEFITFFSNLDIDFLSQKIITFKYTSNYEIDLNNLCNELYSPEEFIFCDLITHIIIFEFRKYKNNFESKSYTLNMCLAEIIKTLKFFKNECLAIINDFSCEKAAYFIIDNLKNQDIQYRMYIGQIEGLPKIEKDYTEIYEIKNTVSYILFDYFQIINIVDSKKEFMFRKCLNCGKYFIPVSRSDEVYCNNVFKSGKTCKEFGYENKLNKDNALKVYRTAYKTQNARMQRNKNIHDYKGRFFDPWNETAKEKVNWVHDGKMSIGEYKQWQVDARNIIEQARKGLLSVDDFKQWLKK